MTPRQAVAAFIALDPVEQGQVWLRWETHKPDNIGWCAGCLREGRHVAAPCEQSRVLTQVLSLVRHVTAGNELPPPTGPGQPRNPLDVEKEWLRL